MTKRTTDIWLGSPESLPLYLNEVKRAYDLSINPEFQSLRNGAENTDSPLLSVQGNVGIIDIIGPIISSSTEWTRYLGIASYPDIRDALVEAANNPDVEHILLNIDSPGGAAKGVEDISTLMNKITTEYKPITAFTNGDMASAAYWIGSAANQIYASRLSTVGSIGVIATHFDVTQSLEQQGVKATVFRAGEFKALGGPYEPLSDAAKALIQGRLDILYSSFVDQVAAGRGVSTEVVRTHMADGREFFGFQAKDVGLIDGVASFEDVALKLRSAASGSRVTLTAQPLEADDMARRKVLDEKAAAILAAGGTLDVALANAPDADEGDADNEQENDQAETSDATEDATTEDDVVATATAAAVDVSLVSYLREELASANTKVMDALVENKALKAKVEAMSASHSQLRGIAEDFTNMRSIALGRGSIDLKDSSDEILVQQFQSITADFNKAYPVGGKCSLPATDEAKPSVANNARAIKAAKI